MEKGSKTPIGNWIVDNAGLPAFLYTGHHPWGTNPTILPDDPYCLLGNDRLTVFAHASGEYQLLTGERSWMRMNHRDIMRGEIRSTLSLDSGPVLPLTGKDSQLAEVAEKEFGTGYASYRYGDCGDGISCERTLVVKPGTELGHSIPALKIHFRLSNTGKTQRTIRIQESILIHPRMMCFQYEEESSLALQYRQRCLQEATFSRIAIEAESDDPYLIPKVEDASRWDAYPPDVYLSVRGQNTSTQANKNILGQYQLTGEAIFELEPGESNSFEVIIGLCFSQHDDRPEKHLEKLQPPNNEEDPLYRQEWAKCLPLFEEEKDSTLRREMIWNAYVLEAMATYHLFYDETYIPQGTAYDYCNGRTAAPRDHLQHLLGVLHFNPKLAKSCLRFVLQKVFINGRIVYTENGYANTSDEMWHTSDQQLYLFFAFAEYLKITGDYRFLLETIPFCQDRLKEEATVLDHLQHAFVFLRDEVGLGEHDLPRIMNSDWNDAIFYCRPIRGHFFTASSHANAAMASVVLDQFSKQMEAALERVVNPPCSMIPFVESIKQYRESITSTLLQEMEGRTFSRRAWLGDGEALGENILYLEPQIFLLQIPEYSIERKIELWKEIEKRLLQNEAIGCRHLEVPNDLEREIQEFGEGENGAFWYALNGPLIVAMAGIDQDIAKSLLLRMGCTHHAECYPDLWLGQWTSSDTINSSLSDRPGQVNRHFPDLIASPAYCAHPHAWALYAYHVIRNTGNLKTRVPDTSDIPDSFVEA